MVLDPTETTKLLGWVAKENITESLKFLINWYQENGIDKVYSHVKNPKNDN